MPSPSATFAVPFAVRAAQLVLVSTLGVATALSAMTHDAPTGGWVGALARAEVTNEPSWTAEMAARFPECKKQREGTVAAAVVVVDSGADTSRVSVDRAYALNTDDERANDVWVVGSCS